MGHILGAASVTVNWNGCRIVFSGDIGRYGDEVMMPPESVESADYLVVESTYGDRLHDRASPYDAIADIVARTVHRGGTVVIPAFAVGRAQSVLYYLEVLKKNGRLPGTLPIFLDSPMAIDASEIFCRNPKDHRLTPAQCKAFAAGAHYVRDAEESKALTANPMAKVIISASGMATGGRVLHHLKQYAPDPRNAILFTGYQAGGTRGAQMVAGADTVKIHGAYVPVRAEVHNLGMLSAHADADEILRWLKGFQRPPKRTFITHGEPNASDALRHRIEEELGWACTVPDHGSKVALA
jgi:metallo-beta-lactamase family protein